MAWTDKYKDGGKTPPEYKTYVPEVTQLQASLFLQNMQDQGADFQKFGVDPETSTIKLIDDRKVRKTTGQKLNPNRDLKTGNYPIAPMYNIVREAKQAGRNPYLALSIGLAESGYGTKNENVGQVLGPGQSSDINPETGQTNEARQLVNAMSRQFEYAKKLGKTKREDIVQGYNGYGKLTPGTEQGAGQKVKSWYGVPITDTLDLGKNPLYGKEITDLSDNIIQKNPAVQAMIKQVYGDEPLPEYKMGGDVKPIHWTSKYKKC